MKLNTKGRYAVIALADIALHQKQGPVTLAKIADRQNLPMSYLEQLFILLRKAGLVEGARGPGGGYHLTIAPEQLPISDIMTAVGETLLATRCRHQIGLGCSKTDSACMTHNLWEKLSAHVHVLLSGISLAEVAQGTLEPCPASKILEHSSDLEGTVG